MLDELAREVFEITKITWLTSQRSTPEEQYDLSETEFLALDALEQQQRQQCLTVGEIQKQIRVLPAQMSRILRNLETRHDEPLVQCSINRDDKRRIDVRITDAGREALDIFRSRKIKLNSDAIGRLSPIELSELLRIVRQIRKAMAEA